MKPSCAHLVEILEKLNQAEGQLPSLKLTYFKTVDSFHEESQNWAKEIKAESLKIHNNEKEIKLKESELEEMTKEIKELMKSSNQLVSQHEELEKELEKAKAIQDADVIRFKEGEGTLASALLKLEDEQIDMIKMNKWAQVFLNRETYGEEPASDCQPNDEMKQIIPQEISSKLEDLNKDLTEVARSKIKFKEQKLKEVKGTLSGLNVQCKDLEKKIRQMEKSVQQLEK